jgi:competence protein ComEA
MGEVLRGLEDAVVTVLTPARRRALAVMLVLAVVLVVGARRLADAGTAREVAAVPVPVVAAADAAPAVLVHVVGAVRAPGLYRLKEGDRVADAVERAGGGTESADLAAVNLAAPVVDGVQVLVPARAEPGARAAAGATGAAMAATGPVSLSSATVADLDALPGIGPITAQKIVDWRDEHGAFRSVDELDAIPGIGPARIEQLRDLVTP